MKEVDLPDGTIAEFPDEMSDVAIAQVLRSKFAKTAAPEPVKQLPSNLAIEERLRQREIDQTGRPLARQVGLAGRYAIEGAAALPAMVANPIAAASNYAFGTNIPEQNQAVTQLLTRAGLPEPQDSTERVVGDVSRAVAGLGTGAPIARLAGAPQYIVNALGRNLGTQTASTVGSAAAAGEAREGGYGAGTQLAAGIIGGVLPVGGIQSTARGLRSLIEGGIEAGKPFTTSGRNQIVGGVLAQSADDVGQAINNIRNVREFVPGSPVTTAEAAGDAGIASLQRGFRNQGANPFSDIESQQNAARQSVVSKLARTPQELEMAIANRSATTAPLYEVAKKESLIGKNFSEIIKKIDSAIENVGTETQAGQELARIKRTIKDSLPKVKTVETGLLDAEGSPITRQTASNLTQGGLIQLYRETRDKAQKISELDGAYPAAVSGVIKPIVHDLGQLLEKQSPNFKKANDAYRALSPEINRMQILQDLKNKVSLTAAPDVRTGYEFLSQPKLTSALRDVDGELAKTLTPEQLDQLNNVRLDAERSASLNARNIRASGSDTAQNLNGGKVVRQFLSEHAVGRLPLGIGRVLQSMSEKQINELTMEALKDPQLARRLLVELRPETARQSLSGAATQKLTAQLLGSIRGTISTPTEQVQQ